MKRLSFPARSRRHQPAFGAPVTPMWPILVVALIAGCASVEAPLPAASGPLSPAAGACSAWFARLDDATARAGVRDSGAYRVPGFPYLRVDRFLSSFRSEAQGDRKKFEPWVARMEALDADARDYEAQNLPPQSLAMLGVAHPRDAGAKTRECAVQLAGEQLGSPALRDALVARAVVPDDYSAWKRDLGLYPVARAGGRAASRTR